MNYSISILLFCFEGEVGEDIVSLESCLTNKFGLSGPPEPFKKNFFKKKNKRERKMKKKKEEKN